MQTLSVMPCAQWIHRILCDFLYWFILTSTLFDYVYSAKHDNMDETQPNFVIMFMDDVSLEIIV